MTDFQPPTTWDEARALLLKDVETPEGVLECAGAGANGDVLHLSFGPKAVTWSSSLGWETHIEARRRVWRYGWEKLAKASRKLVEAVHESYLGRVPVERRKPPVELLRRAKAYLVRNNVVAQRDCPRCGGSGHYSYCEAHGTTCFRCNGKGKVAPTSGDCVRALRSAHQQTKGS